MNTQAVRNLKNEFNIIDKIKAFVKTVTCSKESIMSTFTDKQWYAVKRALH